MVIDLPSVLDKLVFCFPITCRSSKIRRSEDDRGRNLGQNLGHFAPGEKWGSMGCLWIFYEHRLGRHCWYSISGRLMIRFSFMKFRWQKKESAAAKYIGLLGQPMLDREAYKRQESRIFRPVSVAGLTACRCALLAVVSCLHRTDWDCWSSTLPNDELSTLATDDGWEYVSTYTSGSPCMPRDDDSVRRDLSDASQSCKAFFWLIIHKSTNYRELQRHDNNNNAWATWLEWIHKNLEPAYTEIAMKAVFTVQLHVMQCTVLLSKFCPSVHLSVRCVYCDKTKMTHCKYFDTTWNGHHSSFLTPTVVAGRCPLPSEICTQSDPPPSKNADFDRFPLITSQP